MCRYGLTCDKSVQIHLHAHLPHGSVVSHSPQMLSGEMERDDPCSPSCPPGLCQTLRNTHRACDLSPALLQSIHPKQFKEPGKESLVTHPGSGLTCCKVALQRRTWGLWWTKSCPRVSNVSLWPRRPMGAWAALGRALPTSEGGVAPARHIWSSVSHARFLSTRETWSSWDRPN